MQLSTRVGDLQPSPIREILSVIDRPGMISFAGGLPAARSFPELKCDVPTSSLQYGATEGESELRERIADQLRALGFNCTVEQVLVLSGSQQGIDLVAKLFVDRGTRVAVESPTYLAALQVFRFFGASFQAYDPQTLRQRVKDQGAPALLYAIPTFQNPTGHCYSVAERAEVAAVCDAQRIPVFEDDPYRDLYYENCDRQPICVQLEHTSWIYQGSFSKSLAPGLRLGFLIASPDLFPYLVRLKQAADLHSNRLSQFLVLQQLRRPDRGVALAQLATAYRQQRDHFAALLVHYFADLAHWEVPAGGLFFWLTLNQVVDTRSLLPIAIEKGVAFMPGESFYPDAAAATGTLRLNFSHATEIEAERGLATLAAIVREVISSL